MLTRSMARRDGIVVDATGVQPQTRKSKTMKLFINLPSFGSKQRSTTPTVLVQHHQHRQQRTTIPTNRQNRTRTACVIRRRKHRALQQHRQQHRKLRTTLPINRRRRKAFRTNQHQHWTRTACVIRRRKLRARQQHRQQHRKLRTTLSINRRSAHVIRGRKHRLVWNGAHQHQFHQHQKQNACAVDSSITHK